VKAPSSVLVLILMVLALLSAGCEPKVYYYDFQAEGDLNNAEGTWILMEPVIYSFNTYGIVLNGAVICAPHKYSGDFTITSEFVLDASSEPVSLIFYLDSEPFFPNVIPDSEISIWLEANKTLVKLEADEYEKGQVNELYNDYIDVIHVDDLNIIKVVKTGNQIVVSINDDEIFYETLDLYASMWFCPLIFSNSTEGSCQVRDFKVEYRGRQAMI